MSVIWRRPLQLAGPFVVCMFAGILGGCSKSEEKPAQNKVDATPAATQTAGTTPSAAAAQNVENTQIYAELHQSYKQAVIEQTPKDVGRPPDLTVAGKKTAEIWRQIKGEGDAGTGGLWAQIRFMTKEGKRIHYEAVVKTSAGEFQIEMLPDAAPNHARNFIALARAGYYDGLGVDYILKQMYDEQPWTLLLAGCPLGTGEAGQGSIGYWLMPEVSKKYSHEEGVVGAWPLENSACKFYISLTRAPWMDADYTVFGRISKGLDVARKISQAPQQKDDQGKETGDPREPIVIESVTILQTTEN